MTSEFGSSWWGIKRVWLITSEFVCFDGITSSSVSCWEQQSLTRKIFGLVDVEDASWAHCALSHDQVNHQWSNAQWPRTQNLLSPTPRQRMQMVISQRMEGNRHFIRFSCVINQTCHVKYSAAMCYILIWHQTKTHSVSVTPWLISNSGHQLQ